jgi:hypothetical protein
VVKVREDVQVPYQDAAQTALSQELAEAWATLSKDFGGALSLDRALPEADPESLQGLVVRAREGRSEDLPNLPALTKFFAVTAPEGVDVAALATAINQLSFVEIAYPEERTTLPAPSQNPNDPEFPNQSYLQPAPLGVNALTAWLEPRGDGESVRLIDIEFDWLLNHPDLPAVTVGSGQRSGEFIEHGTNVLGIIIAVPENQRDCVGVAAAASVEVIPVVRQNGSFDPQSALVAATLDLLPVDPAGPTPVILIEQQSGRGGPVEEAPLFATAIASVVGLGIAVVEPAGNGAVDLDAFAAVKPSPFERQQFDSGAIIVGACFGPSHEPMLARMQNTIHGSSSFGNRVDCFAQGDEVVTLSAEPNNPVTRQFGGTSAASAIVAAAACSVSAMHTAQLNTPVTPLRLRSLLSDPAVNQPSAAPEQDKIGVMPNLNAIIRQGV